VSTAPTIGRIVHYVSYGTPGGEYAATCRAALVTEVSVKRADPNEIGLAVVNPTGMFFDRQVRQSEGDHAGGTWHWPCEVVDEGLGQAQQRVFVHPANEEPE
jgi:hypothetical protein